MQTSNILECINIDITDEMLKDAKIAAYMANQTMETPSGKVKPYAPKSFPDKAVVIQFNYGPTPIQIYLDTKAKTWNSSFTQDGHIAKLSPEQLDSFFSTKFYAKLVNSLSKKWPTSDPQYAELYKAVMECSCSTQIREDEMEKLEALDEVDQPGKNKELANKDVDHDNKRDYAGSGRKIVHFSDMGVNGKSGEYFCWPRKGKEFKWNSWKNWKKLKPFAKMYFKHNGRKYMISLSLFDENFDHRGFRGADVDWTPPFAWTTPEECNEIMQLSIVRKFLRQCLKRTKPYMDMSPEEVLKKIDKPEKVTIKDIEKTQRVIKHVLKTVFKEQQADDYKYD